MDLYVVLDTMGDGRVVGVFDSEAAAAQVIGEFRAYYKLHRCRLNEITAEALGWARDDLQRAHLERLIAASAKP